jgi:alpha-mannosidase
MLIDQAVKSMYRKIAVLELLSIRRILRVMNWVKRVGDKVYRVETPIILGKENIVLETTIESFKEEGVEYLLFPGKYNALLYINNEPYYGIDEYTRIVPLPENMSKYSIRLVIYPSGIKGEKYKGLVFDKAYHLLIYRDLSDFIKHLKWTLDLALAIRSRDKALSDKLLMLIDKYLSKIPIQNPHPEHMVIYEEYTSSKMSQYPEIYSDTLRLFEEEGEELLREGYGLIDYNIYEKILPELRRGFYEELMDLRRRYSGFGKLYVVANTHIDLAWLWSFKDTIWKIGKTIAKINTLFRIYKEPVFVFSSSYYAELLEKNYPELWNRFKQLILGNRIIPVSGVFVESDVYIIPSETLVREFLYGQELFIKYFGRRAVIGWLPDSFGFSANLPQIMREAGIKLFITHKPVWNDTNKFPYHTFIWRGIDGSEIPTHIISGGLDKRCDPGSMIELLEDYPERNIVSSRIYTYGYCDGGSGPTDEMIERLRFYSKLAPGMPEIIHGELDGFIDEIVRSRDELPVWHGEIYLEAHRGSYTSDTCVKEGIWRLDYLLRLAEQISTHLMIRGMKPLEGLRESWSKQLQLAFHDVASGTITHSVHVEACRIIREESRRVEELIREGLKKITNNTSGIIIYNPTQWTRREYVEINNKILEVTIPGLTYTIIPLNNSGDSFEEKVSVREDMDRLVITNKFWEIVIGRDGLIYSIKDLETGYEYLAKPSAEIRVYEDLPSDWDAWNIEEYTLRHSTILKPRNVEVARNEGVLVEVRISYEYLHSRINLYIKIYGGDPRIYFRFETDWRDKWRLVKIWFYPRIYSVKAYCDTHFGVVERSVLSNNSWEKAMFETPMISWCSLEDFERGFAILSRYKHGVTTRYMSMGLSLLKSPVIPNPYSDLGGITIDFAILPYRGSWRTHNIYKLFKEYVNPLYILVNTGGGEVGGEKNGESLLRIIGDLVVETIKPGEDGGIVVRMYNYNGLPGNASIIPSFKVSGAVRTSILEEKVRNTELVGENIIRYMYRPYEIVTLKLLPGNGINSD